MSDTPKFGLREECLDYRSYHFAVKLSEGALSTARGEDLSDPRVRTLSAVPGVETVHILQYGVTLKRSDRFTWAEMEERLTAALNELAEKYGEEQPKV